MFKNPNMEGQLKEAVQNSVVLKEGIISKSKG